MEKKSLKGRLDYVSMIIPLLGVVLLCVLFMLMPAKSSYIIQMNISILFLFKFNF